MITYQIEPLADILGEVKQLAGAHYDEFATDKDARPLDPNWDTRLKCEKVGAFMAVTARDSALVGYVFWFITADMTSQRVQRSEADVYYVRPGPTRGLILRSMIRVSLRRLAERGVSIVRSRTKIGADGPGRDSGPIWSALGFKPTDVVYSRKLSR